MILFSLICILNFDKFLYIYVRVKNIKFGGINVSKRLRKIFIKFRNVIALLLVVVMTVSLVPVMGENVQAHAQEETENKNDITGSGTEQDPYVIYTYEGLKEFARIVNGESTLHENKPYVWGELANDIICTDKQWVPIGYYINTNVYVEYTGHFDGKNYKVLYLSNEEIEEVNNNLCQGLFGLIGESGEVKNIRLENGGFYGNEFVGGVAGENDGTITNCYNTGSVSGTRLYVGGIAGTNYGTIANCYNTGSVSGTRHYVGGVVGANYASDSGMATVTNCYNTGAVSGSNNVGGVVGDNHTYDSGATAIVTNCYNTGAVSGSNNVGGVVGFNMASYSKEKTIVKNCFNIGAVSGNGDEIGGVIGAPYDGSNGLIINCYYDKSRCTIYSGLGIGLEIEDMTGSEAFKENHMVFSYANTQDNPWLLKENDANNFFYPHLKGFNTEEKVENGQVEIIQLDADKISVANWPARILSGSANGGSQDNPYEISDYNMLKQFSDIVNGTNGYTSNTSACAVLTNDIICTDKTWVPIGNDTHKYTGYFDGNNKKIFYLSNEDIANVNSMVEINSSAKYVIYLNTSDGIYHTKYGAATNFYIRGTAGAGWGNGEGDIGIADTYRFVTDPDNKAVLLGVTLSVGDFKISDQSWSHSWGFKQCKDGGDFWKPNGETGIVIGGAKDNFEEGESDDNIHCKTAGTYNIYLTNNWYVSFELAA